MESLLFAGVSMLILLPILYFLPLGFTNKGKVFIVVASLLIGLLGIVSVAVLPLWQTGLILLIFVSALVYLLSKRDLEWLYQAEMEYEDPFHMEEEEESQPVKVINDNYQYIASSEKIPKGQIVEDSSSSLLKKDPASISLLEKLVSRNERDLSMLSKSNEQNDAEEPEIQELILEDYQTNTVEPDFQSPELVDTEKEFGRELDSEIETIVHKREAQPEDEVEAYVQKNEDFLDADIEAIVHNTEELSEKLEAASTKNEDTYDYLSDVERMLETGEIDMTTELNMLEPISASKAEQRDVEEQSEVGSWLEDELELVELQSEEALSHRAEVSDSSVSGREREEGFDLEKLVLNESDSLQNSNSQKEKKQEQAVDENNMVKQ